MKIVLGAAQFGSNYGITNKKKLLLKDVAEILKYSRKYIKYIDTAIDYEKSNNVLSKIDLRNFKINSKIIIKKKHEKYNLICEELLFHINKLGLDNLDYLFIHNTTYFNKMRNRKKIISNFERLKKENLIKGYGISVYDPSEFLEFYKVGKPSIIQFPYNVFDKRFINKKTLNLIKKNNIILQSRSCFLQGLLNSDKLPSNFKRFKNLFNAWTEWCNSKKISKTDACLMFVKKNNLIKQTVVGVSNLQNLKDILKINNKKLIKFPHFNNVEKKLIDPRKW